MRGGTAVQDFAGSMVITPHDQRGKLDNLDFAKVAKNEFQIDAVEYVNQFFMDKAQDQAYLGEMKKRAADLGVKSLLIMIDGEEIWERRMMPNAPKPSRTTTNGSMRPSSSVATAFVLTPPPMKRIFRNRSNWRPMAYDD